MNRVIANGLDFVVVQGILIVLGVEANGRSGSKEKDKKAGDSATHGKALD
jgi:hypothetical protein